MKKTTIASISAVLGLLLCSQVNSQVVSKVEAIPINTSCTSYQYNIVDLGSFDSNNRYTYSFKLNNTGNAVGTSNTQPNSGHAFYYTNNGGMQDIHPGNVDFSNAESINDRNNIVGTTATAMSGGSASSVFYYDQRSVQILATSQPLEDVHGVDINNQNDVLINRYNFSDYQHQVTSSSIWKNGQNILTFDANGRDFFSKAFNDNRVVVGWIFTPISTMGNQTRGFVWQNRSLQVLSALDESANNYANANNINNNSSVIVGFSTKVVVPRATLQRPVYWLKNSAGGYVVRDILNSSSTEIGIANAVNNQKYVVGEMSLSNRQDRHAFLYSVTDNNLVDLRTKVNYMGSRVLESAVDINDHCQILVNGRDAQGAPASFRLDPVDI